MALSVRIQKRLGSFRLDVSFQAENEVVALLGASGCGKSMTLKCIAGIVRPDEGYIELDGKVLFDSSRNINLTPQERRVGYLFQSYALFPNMTVRQNIAAGIRKAGKTEKEALVREKIAAMRLEGLEDRYPRELSGGQRQRTALARILVGKPRLLLLDEPFAALDSYLKWQLELELADVLADFGGSAVYVSHNMDEVCRLCDSVCVLHDGVSEPKTRVRRLFENPGTLSACLLSGCKNISRAAFVDEGHIRAVDWGVTLAAARPVPRSITHIGVRACRLAPEAGAGENVVRCAVRRITEDVSSVIVILSAGGGGGSPLRLELPRSEREAVKSVRRWDLLIEPDNIMFLTG